MGLQTWKARPRNMACHNLLRLNPLPRGVNNLLGLGLNYCIKTDTSTKTTANTFERFRNDVRRTYEFHINPPVLEEDEYIPKLYIKSGFKFDPATDEIENALIKFERAILEEQKQCQRRRKLVRNITVGQWDLIQFLRRNDLYIVVEGDKNLGPYNLDRIAYIKRGCLEHLGNSTNYKQLNERWAKLQ